MPYNRDLQQFVDQMATQARVLNSFDLHMEVEEGRIVVRHPDACDKYVHEAGTESIAIGALGWYFSRSIKDSFACGSIFEYLRNVKVFECDEEVFQVEEEF